MKHISLIFALGILLLISACANPSVKSRNMVPQKLSLVYEKSNPSISIGKVTEYYLVAKKDAQKISAEVFKQALYDSFSESRLFEKVAIDDLSAHYILETDLMYNERKAGFGKHPTDLVVRYKLFDMINGEIKWYKDIYSFSKKGNDAKQSEQAGRASILRLIHEISQLQL